MPQYFHFTETF